MNDTKFTKTGQPVVNGRFQSKLTPDDLAWIKDNRELNYEDIEYEIKKRLRSRGELYERSGEMIYRNVEKILSI